MDIPTVTAEQMAQIDDLATRHFGLEVYQLMENAGRSAAEVARGILGSVKGREITILCGKGNNGGDGLVVARYLSNWGAKPSRVILACHPDELTQTSREQFGVLKSMFVEVLHPKDALMFETALKKSDLIIDGLIGCGIDGDPKGLFAELIQYTNENSKKVLSIDIPSGLNPDTGEPYNPCIKADATVTFCLPKKGLLDRKAKDYVGKLYLADIGIPHEVFEKLGWDFPKVFWKESIIKL